MNKKETLENMMKRTVQVIAKTHPHNLDKLKAYENILECYFTEYKTKYIKEEKTITPLLGPNLWGDPKKYS